MWGLGEGDWRSALSLLELDVSTGQGSLCTAGRGASYIITSNGFRPLATPGQLLATQPEAVFSHERFTLNSRDALLMFSPLPATIFQKYALEFNDLLRYAHGLLGKPARETIDLLTRRWLELGLPYDVEKSLLWLTKNEATPKKKPRPTSTSLVGSDSGNPTGLKSRRVRKSR
jgi:hypothetical protein